MIRVVHCKRFNGPMVYIGRPSVLGNPFTHKDGTIAMYRVKTVQEAVARYEEYAREAMKRNPAFRREVMRLVELSKHGDVNLACWCKIRGNEPCHGDIIKKLIEEII